MFFVKQQTVTKIKTYEEITFVNFCGYHHACKYFFSLFCSYLVFSRKAVKYILTVSEVTVVSAWSTVKAFEGVSPVPFDTVGANIGNMWDNITHKFTMTETQGIFYVALSAVKNYNKQLDFVLQKSNQPLASCGHTYTPNYRIISTARDLILNIGPSDTLHVSSSTGYFTSQLGYTGIGIFNIAELMSSDDLVVFSVARDSPLYEAADPITFNQILVNDQSHYDTSSNKFTAPSSGVYFFTFSVGVPAPADESSVEFILYLNNAPFTTIIHEPTGIDVIGRSIMIYLDESDTVHVVNKGYSVAYSSQLLETSFAGFKYEPAHGNKVYNKKKKLRIIK